MSTTTNNLSLFKYDPATDGAQTFNIQTALNNNWDALDAADAAKIKTDLSNLDAAALADKLHVSGDNRLINSGFKINQRGQPSYVGEWNYCVDGWILYTGTTLTVQPDGVVVTAPSNDNGYLFQRLEQGLFNVPACFAVQTDADIYAATGSMTKREKFGAATPFGQIYVDADADGDNQFVAIQITAGKSVKLRRTKFEQGDHTTLLNDPPADYDEELRKCQRYYYDSAYNNSGMAGTFASKEFYNTSYMMCNVRFPVQLRTVPSVIIKSVIGNLNTVSVWENGQDAVTNCTVNYATLGSNGFNAIISESGEFNIDSTYTFHVVASADL